MGSRSKVADDESPADRDIVIGFKALKVIPRSRASESIWINDFTASLQQPGLSNQATSSLW